MAEMREEDNDNVDSDIDLDEDDLFNTSNYREQRLEELKRQYVHRQFHPWLGRRGVILVL